MAMYEYSRPDGRTLTIHRPMTDAPAMTLVELPDGSTRPATDDDPAHLVYRRDFGRVQFAPTTTIDHCVTPKGRRGPPVSHALPRRREKGDQIRKIGDVVVREHKDGSMSTLAGKPIIDSNKARRDAEARTGFKWTP